MATRELNIQPSADKVWGAAREHLQAMLSADTYKLGFEPLRVGGMDGEHIVLEVSNDFCEVWLKDNYIGLLQLVRGNCFLHHQHRLDDDADYRMRRTQKRSSFGIHVDGDHDIGAERAGRGGRNH